MTANAGPDRGADDGSATIDRRRLLGTLGALGAGSVAGCLGVFGSDDGSTPGGDGTAEPTPAPRPAEAQVYVPSRSHGMVMRGTASLGDARVALTYSVPDPFFTIIGTEVSETAVDGNDSVHMMATVWDPDTRTVIPETGLSLEITRPDGTLVSQEVIYPMLSQRMGAHHGGNFSLPGAGSYDVTVGVGGTSLRRTGSLAGRFGEPASHTFEFEYDPAEIEAIEITTPQRAGREGALPPMDMEMPQSTRPPVDSIPGPVVAAGSHAAADLRVSYHGPDSRFGGDDAYLALAAATPYNRLTLPEMGVEGTLRRDGESVASGRLERTIDHELGYHYGIAVPEVRDGDGFDLTFLAPPQVARHVGYESAFVTMTETSLPISL